MKKVLDHVRDAIFIIEGERITFLNKSASALLNIPKEHLIGKEISGVAGNATLIKLLRNILKEWKNSDNSLSEYFSIKMDKYACTLIPLRDLNKETAAIIVSNLIDKSQRDIMSNASHELKTPLTSIKGFAETLLLDGLKNKDMAMRYLNIIEKEASRMSNLLNELLDILKLEADDFHPRYEEVNLKEVIQYVMDLVKPLAMECNVSLDFEADENINMFGDPELLTQLFSNLLDNAVKYTAQKIGEKRARVSLFKRENEIIIQVADTGIGIPKDAIPHIFDRFYRSEKSNVPGKRGSGLGLSIVQSIVERYKGYIEVDSEEGRGTTFTIHFPLQNDRIVIEDVYSRKVMEIKSVMEEAQSILVTGHIRPDGDCISSVLGLSYALRKLGKKVFACLQDDVPHVFRGIPTWQSIFKPQELKDKQFDLVFILDSSDKGRIGKVNELLEKKDIPIVVIDHHKTSKDFGDINWIDSSYASTSQIIYEFLKAIRFDISPEHAQILLTGIATDTGFFKYSNVTHETLEDASELVALGARINDIANMVLENITLEQLKLHSLFLQTLHVELNGKLGWGYISEDMFKQTNTKEEDSTFFVQTIRSINTVEVAILFIEHKKGDIHVEFRSKKYFDVSEIAVHFGGGGHARAAGCTLKDTSLEKTETKVLQYVRERISL
ncbi:MAG: hypothetical protein DRP50_00550 [Thermotoga sp.]|nr:MAG: hypothetical protein DRP50_00550 [Thermotoga sp.]